MSIFIEVGEYIIETSEITTGSCVFKYKDGAMSYAHNTDYFEVCFHKVVDKVGLKKVTECYHVYSNTNELPLEYKLKSLRNLLREASRESEEHALQTLQVIKEQYFRDNDAFDLSKKIYIMNHK